MSEPLSDADKIRNKRLAKLGGGGGGSGGLPASSAASSPKESNGPQQSSPSALTPQQSSETSPDYNAAGQETLVRDKRIKITPTSGTPRVPSPSPSSSPAPAPAPAPPKPRVVPKAEESFETFEDRTLRALFGITLDETQQKNIYGQKLTFLPGVLSELRDEGSDVRLSIGILDQAILEAASKTGRDTPLDYLLPCWKRVRRLIKGFRKSSENDPRFNVVSEAKRLCLSYCVFAVTMPEMFGQNPTSRSPLIPNLLVEAEDDRGVDLDFLAEVVKLFEEQEDLKPAIISAVEQMSQELSIMSMNDDYKPYLTALRNLVHNAVIASTIAESSRFLSETDAASFELNTLLGPYFRLSPLQAPVTTTYFSSPKTRDQGFILNSQRSLRMTQQLLSSDLLDVLNHLIRASKEAREKVLDWFAAAINLNHKRRALQVDPRAVSSDGFMFNITTCLDQLCEPFMDASFSKIDRIDALYLHRNPRVQMRDETKINADQQTSDEFYARKESGTSNFISEVFFLTVAAHHYGSESLTSKLEQLEKDLRHMETQINKFELERHKWIHNPMQLRTYEEALKKYKDRLDLGISLKYSLQGVLFDTTWQTRSMQFMRYVIVWILRLVSGTDFPKQKLSLPLPEEPQEIFKCLPEYFIDDIVSNFKFIMWSMPQIITTAQGDELVMLCIAFLESSQYIKNPYLKAGLISIIFRGTWPRSGGARGILVDLLNSLPFANTYLLHAVMKFYIEVEHTGTHTQFFDKFNIRYEIFQIIKCIWGNPAYRNQLSGQATDNLDFFVRFVNLLLNDVTFVLDEAFTAFITIHDTQELLNREGSNLEETVRKEKEEALSAAQGRAKSYMQLTNETVAMLKLFTEALADSFTMPEIVQRLADMLDYNLDAMVGPKSSNLHVGNLQEYGFNPRGLLSEIIDVYINLMNKENFIVAVARDGRSYKPQNFEKAAEIIRKRALKSDEELAKLVELARRIKQAKEADDQAEEDLGEIPDDFLDPLIYTLMEDPVILPSSNVTIDRATIRSHLLSDPNDPFNRAPLKIEDVIPNTDLKKQIEEFKAERKAAKLRALKEAEIMDTSTG